MAFIGLNKAEVQRRIDAAINAVDASLRREYDGRLAREQEARQELESRLAESETAREANAKEFAKDMAAVMEQLAEYRQHCATSQTLGAITRPSSVTFASVLEMAATISDEGYQGLRDFFMVEAAKQGYSPSPNRDNYARLKWKVEDTDSGLGVYFIRGHTHKSDELVTGTHFSVSNTNGSDPELHHLGSGQLIDYSTSQDWQLSEIGKVFVLLDERRKEHLDKATYSLVVSPLLPVSSLRSDNTDNAWRRRLQDDLPEIFKAHIFGVALSYLDGTHPEAKRRILGRAECYGRTALLMHRHGLETCTPLLRRAAEVMRTDAVLAGALMTYYDADAAQLRLPMSYQECWQNAL